MKRKIAILLAAVMTTAMLPMNVSASSSNTINKVATVKTDDIVEGVYLKVQPNDAILSGDSIVITVENAEFDTDKVEIEQYDKNVDWWGAMDLLASGSSESTILTTIFNGKGGNYTNELPYLITRNGKKEIEVKLFPISSIYTNKDYNDGYNVGKPVYQIPINVKATTAGDVKVTIDANSTSISGGGTYTVATASSSSGSTTTTVDKVKDFMDDGELEDIVIKETVKDTFKSGQTVKMRLSGGFKINKSKSDIQVVEGTNATFTNAVSNLEVSDDEIRFTMPEFEDRSKVLAIRVEGIVIEADDDDKDWGDVNLTVSGAGLTRETIKVAVRSDYGFKLTALEDPKTIMAGRLYSENTSRLNDDDFITAEFKFEETIENTWITDRKLEFYVPEGVKIVNYEFNDDEYINDDIAAYASIASEGTVLKIDKGIDIDTNECSSVKIKLYLSADADYTGDVTVNVRGGGLQEGVIDGIVIANVVTPIKIESAPTKTNVGYQKVDSADITITEADAGVMLKSEEVIVELDGAYKTEDIGFSDDGITYEITGDLEITNFKVSNGAIKFKVDKESYKEPASIKIKNVKVGSTRSVSYGSYDINVYGSAIINNYDEDDVKDINYPVSIATSDSKEIDRLGHFDTTEKYAFKDYITIVTETGTLDSVVKVTIGEKQVLVDDQAYDMDVAPYIQTESASTMVPIRFVSIALGIDTDAMNNPDESSKIVWDPNTKTATILYAAGNGQKIVQFVAGSNDMIVDGTAVPMSYGVKAEIVDGRMFVPFRAVGNAFGIKVDWDEATKTAIYNQK
jgi:hypothetical protein